MFTIKYRRKIFVTYFIFGYLVLGIIGISAWLGDIFLGLAIAWLIDLVGVITVFIIFNKKLSAEQSM